jgi:DNA-binding transcriptional LysR family regulator
MEVKWIEDFVALAQYLSFSRAAEVRNVTQSGFSRRIQALEQWIGAELIDRGGYPPTLTAAGRLFKEAADEILLKLYDTRAVIRNDRRMPGIGLQIAAGHTIALNFVPRWLASLPSEFQRIRTRVVPTNVHDSILMLANSNCELVFAYHHPALPLLLDPGRYEHLALGRDTLMPVSKRLADGRPMFGLASTLERMPVPLLAYAETSYFGRCLAFLLQKAKSVPPMERRYESDMAELLKKMALAGEGLAWLPRSSVTDELSRGELVVAGGHGWRIELEIRVYRDVSQRLPLVDSLWAHLQQAATDGGA